MRWPGLRLGLVAAAGAGLLVCAALTAQAVVADSAPQNEDSAFSSLYIEPIAVSAGIMLDTQGLVRAAVVATKDAQGNVVIECRDQHDAPGAGQ